MIRGWLKCDSTRKTVDKDANGGMDNIDVALRFRYMTIVSHDEGIEVNEEFRLNEVGEIWLKVIKKQQENFKFAFRGERPVLAKTSEDDMEKALCMLLFLFYGSVNFDKPFPEGITDYREKNILCTGVHIS